MEALFRKERYIGNAGIKNLPASDGAAGDADFIPESGRYPGGGNGGPLQHSCLEITWTEGPGRLQSMGSQRVRHNLVTEHLHTTQVNK